MRRAVVAVVSASALLSPTANAWATNTSAKTTPKKKVVVKTKSFTGTAGSADRWGDVQVTIVVKRTTTTNLTTKKKTVKRRITAVKVPVYPDHTDRSIFINEQALPILVQETIQAQSTGIDLVSGATYTSQGFDDSLQSAILKARAWKS